MRFLIGTRGSKLAVAQAEYVRFRLQRAWPQHEFAIRTISTKGDKITDKPLRELGRDIFVREIEQELLDGTIHIAVHSMKDMPAEPAPGLVFAPCMEREDARDALILREASSLEELPKGAVIGTGSVRRRAQLLRLRPDLRIRDIRGNVDTRLRKLCDREENLDGIVLAAAGLHRLGMRDKITQYLSFEQMLPSAAQGTLGVEICENRKEIMTLFKPLRDEKNDIATSVERDFLRLGGGSCHMPCAALCEEISGGYRLRAMTGAPDGSRLFYADVQGANAGELAKKALRQIRESEGEDRRGTVYLVGAGPGDIGLLTVRSAELLRQAECVLYDSLVSPDLLSLTSVECEKICVGKRNRSHTLEQEEILELMLKKAEEYTCVVRLKGGDPYVFGRGGEEAAFLRAHGISCRVVPGVTSAVAAPSCAGIPVTHRGVAGGFRVVTAHDEKGLAAMDLASMAGGKETCLFLMGLGMLENIVEGLLKHGMSGQTKAAVVSGASTERQRVCAGALADIAGLARAERMEGPAVIVVGDVVGLREELPLWECTGKERGRAILLPTIGDGGNALVRRLGEKGIGVEKYVVGEIAYVESPVTREELAGLDWLAFTSKHGVRGFMEQLLLAGLDSRALSRIRLASVGEKTSEALREYGLRADLTASAPDVKTLFAELAAIGKDSQICYVRGGEAAPAPKAGEGNGRWCERVVYENREAWEEPGIDFDQYDTAVFTCASSARRLTGRLPGKIPDKWQKNGVFSIGKSCTRELKQLGYRTVKEAETASYEALCEKICRDGPV